MSRSSQAKVPASTWRFCHSCVPRAFAQTYAYICDCCRSFSARGNSRPAPRPPPALRSWSGDACRAIPARTRTNSFIVVDSGWFLKQLGWFLRQLAQLHSQRWRLSSLCQSRRPRFCFQCCVCSPASCGSDLARRCLNSVWSRALRRLSAPRTKLVLTATSSRRVLEFHGARRARTAWLPCPSHRTLPAVCLHDQKGTYERQQLDNKLVLTRCSSF